MELEGNTYTDLEVTGMRRTIADRLLESKNTIPHYYMTASVEMDNLMDLRSQLNDVSDVRVSVNDMLVKAIGLACVEVPETNSHWLGDSIRQFDNVDVSVAVATDTGLITPIVTNANNRTLGSIAQRTQELITKAREGTL